MDRHALIHRVRSEFVEIPGPRVTVAQATRLWGLDRAACEAVIDALVTSEFLRWTAAGTIVRADC